MFSWRVLVIKMYSFVIVQGRKEVQVDAGTEFRYQEMICLMILLGYLNQSWADEKSMASWIQTLRTFAIGSTGSTWVGFHSS